MSIATEKSFRIPVELEEESPGVPRKTQLQKLTQEITKNRNSVFYNYIDNN